MSGKIYTRHLILQNKVRPHQWLWLGDEVYLKPEKTHVHIYKDDDSDLPYMTILTPAAPLSALNSVANRLILFYPGTYNIGSTLTLGDDVSLYGLGDVIFQYAGGSGETMLILGNNNKLTDIHFAVGNNDYIPISVGNSAYLARLTITGVTSAIAPKADGISDVIIEDCVFDTVTNAYYHDTNSVVRWKFKTNRYINVTTVYNLPTMTDCIFVYDGV